MMKSMLLGIDAGGTHTDAVLVSPEDARVLVSAKALTTHHDLSVGIRNAVASLPGDLLAQVTMVGLSTTLATNAIVEGKGHPACLLLVGYDQKLVESYSLRDRLVSDDVVFLAGGHGVDGREKQPLDIAAAREAILARRGRAEAFAVASYFSVRNPAHELRLRALIRELVDTPVTCGHELSDELDSIKRATTTALNAQLIPVLRKLILGLREALASLGILAPIMVVRGDGSLMRAEMALERPVETILSGPAASALGASFLCGVTDSWVIDMGGTTTDIVALSNGLPSVNPKGAVVGGWRTMVRAVDTRTAGLGGDSQVRVDRERHLLIGPRRVVPLSLLAASQPVVLNELRRQLQAQPLDRAGEFLMANPVPEATPNGDETMAELMAALAEGPRSWLQLQRRVRHPYLLDRVSERMEALGLITRSAFTPTDALHLLGSFDPWCREAAEMAAQLLARLCGTESTAFCQLVVDRLGDAITLEVVAKVLGNEEGPRRSQAGSENLPLLRRAQGAEPESDLQCKLILRPPVVAIGAPAHVYVPRAARQLHTQLMVPEHAPVASAVGSVVGSVVQVVEGSIEPTGSSKVRLHLGGEVRDFPTLEDAIADAERAGSELACQKALLAGATDVKVDVWREDRQAPVGVGNGKVLYLGTELRFTGVGRPACVARPPVVRTGAPTGAKETVTARPMVRFAFKE